MNLTYHLKRHDILFGRMSLMIRNKVLLAISILIIGFLVFSICSGEEFHKASLPVRIVIIFFSIGLATTFYVGVQFVIHLIMVVFSKQAGVLGSHTLEIKDEGLEESTAVNKSLHRWNPLFVVREFGNYVWIYPTDGHFFLIPKRRGGHEGNLAEFIIQLKAKIGK